MSLRDFVLNTNPGNNDLIIQVIQDLYSVATPAGMDEIKTRLDAVKSEIETTNRSREILGGQSDTLLSLKTELENYAKRLPKPDPEIELLLSFIATRLTELRRSLADGKPAALLTEKHDLNARLAFMQEYRRVAAALETLVNAGRNKKVSR